MGNFLLALMMVGFRLLFPFPGADTIGYNFDPQVQIEHIEPIPYEPLKLFDPVEKMRREQAAEAEAERERAANLEKTLNTLAAIPIIIVVAAIIIAAIIIFKRKNQTGRFASVPISGIGDSALPAERLIAALIDGGIVVGAFIAVEIIALIIGIIPILGALIGMLLNLGIMIAAVAYFIYLPAYDNPWTGRGQTIGKRMRGIKIVNEDGSNLSVGNAAIRYIGYIVSAFVALLGFVWILIDAKQQGWHDKIAKTYVVKV